MNFTRESFYGLPEVQMFYKVLGLPTPVAPVMPGYEFIGYTQLRYYEQPIRVISSYIAKRLKEKYLRDKKAMLDNNNKKISQIYSENDRLLNLARGIASGKVKYVNGVKIKEHTAEFDVKDIGEKMQKNKDYIELFQKQEEETLFNKYVQDRGITFEEFLFLKHNQTNNPFSISNETVPDELSEVVNEINKDFDEDIASVAYLYDKSIELENYFDYIEGNEDSIGVSSLSRIAFLCNSFIYYPLIATNKARIKIMKDYPERICKSYYETKGVWIPGVLPKHEELVEVVEPNGSRKIYRCIPSPHLTSSEYDSSNPLSKENINNMIYQIGIKRDGHIPVPQAIIDNINKAWKIFKGV